VRVVRDRDPSRREDAGWSVVTEWRDHSGPPLVAYRGGGFDWLEVEGLALFRLPNAPQEEVAAYPAADVGDDWVEDTFLRSVLPLAIQRHGRQVMHASAVRTSGGVVALCGLSGAGKSTTAFALGRRGHAIVADDALPFEVKRDRADVFPIPFRVRLRPDVSVAVGTSGDTVTRSAGGPYPLAAIVLLARTGGGGAPAVQRVEPQRAFPALLSSAYCFSLEERSSKGRLANDYLDLVERVPVFEAQFGGKPTAIDALAAAVESAVLESR